MRQERAQVAANRPIAQWCAGKGAREMGDEAFGGYRRYSAALMAEWMTTARPVATGTKTARR